MATYYVTTSGSDSNNGLTEGTAFATPGYAAGQATTSGDLVYIKSGTYTLSTTTSNVSGGPLSISRGVSVEGYQTTAGDLASKPVINAGTQAVAAMITIDPFYNLTNGTRIKSIELDGNSSASTGFQGNPFVYLIENCVARNCTSGFASTQGYEGLFSNCSAYDCTSYGFYNAGATYCLAKSCSVGFRGSSSINGKVFYGCVADSNSLDGFDLHTGYFFNVIKCVAYNNGASGFKANFDIGQATQCIAADNSAYGYDLGGTNACPLLIDSADYNNNSGRSRSSGTTRELRPINLTGDPFTSASTGDFTLNNNAGAGAELRQIQLSGLAGVNSVFDVGAIDAVVTAGGTKFHPLS